MRRAGSFVMLGVVLLMVGAPTVGLGQELGPKEPIRPDFARFLQAEFGRVPAASVVANIPKATCQQIHVPSAGQGTPQMFLCNVDLGCNQIGQVPVGVMPDGRLAFFPDTPEEVVFYACPASISDPARRAKIEHELALPPLTVTRIN
jgi:hypothetical protein